MSEDNNSFEGNARLCSCCASCGVAEIDDIKLKECNGCDLVKYCSVECQEGHKSEHEEACKKRAAELRDEILFKQPDGSHHGDCPICSLPLSLDREKSTIMGCCSKVICMGCRHANQKREWEMRFQHTCLFCREPTPETVEEYDKLVMKRAEAGDSNAMRIYAAEQRNKGNNRVAFEYFSKAAELGDAEAHNRLAWLYQKGLGVEKDEEKSFHHLEEAAIGGHPNARSILGCKEYSNGNVERAVKHFIIAAAQGEDNAIKILMEKFREGRVGKDVLAVALRAQKAAVDATKSPQRVAADEYYRKNGLH